MNTVVTTTRETPEEVVGEAEAGAEEVVRDEVEGESREVDMVVIDKDKVD